MSEQNLNNLPSQNIATPNEDGPKKREEMTVPIVTGAIQEQRKHTFADDVRDISATLWREIVLPSVKKGTSDFLGSMINMVLFGNNNNGGNNQWLGGQNNGINQYQNYTVYSQQNGQPTYNYQQPPATSMGVTPVIYATRQDAEAVLGRMWQVLGTYGWVSVADYHQISNVSTSTNNHRFGWTTLDNVQIMSNGSGWYITLPNPISDR